jgi:hypothetical protein
MLHVLGRAQRMALPARLTGQDSHQQIGSLKNRTEEQAHAHGRSSHDPTNRQRQKGCSTICRRCGIHLG